MTNLRQLVIKFLKILPSLLLSLEMTLAITPVYLKFKFLKRARSHTLNFYFSLCKKNFREVPGGPMFRTWCFHCRGPGSIPGWETRSHKPQGQKKVTSYVLPQHPKHKITCQYTVPVPLS